MKKEHRFHSPKESIFKRIAKILTHRSTFGVIFILLELGIFVATVLAFSRYFAGIYLVERAISLVAVLYIVNRHGHPDYKLGWVITLLCFPLFGGLFYLLFGGARISGRNQQRMNRLGQLNDSAMGLEENMIDELGKYSPEASGMARYIERASHCPPHRHTETEYFPLCDDNFIRLMEELRKAEHYIFMEYFIIREGYMWDSILEVLEEKVKQGVDVRLMYDDIGCLFCLPNHYAKRMRDKGIACAVFNPFRPIVSLRLNNRDHRKICVIDGHTGFTGGWNLSDEYINRWERFGHWKDTGIMLKGEAVWNLTVMFLSVWDYTVGVEDDLERYRPNMHRITQVADDGIILPFTDSPLDNEPVGATVYHLLISHAMRYCYIMTPYLILDYDMQEALVTAAKTGVDVRIITPHIPDKRTVFEMTRGCYRPLQEAGVKIYEYTPGFIHAKSFVVDDEYAVVGTINLDYRSLYLHFECGVWMYHSSSVSDIRDDFLATQEKSQLMPMEDTGRLGWAKRLLRSLLRVFAPLL